MAFQIANQRHFHVLSTLTFSSTSLFELDGGKVLSAIYSISTYFANTTFMHIPHILPCFWVFCVRFRSANLTTINAIGGKNSGKRHDGETDNQIRKDNHKELPITLEAKRTLHML